MALVDVLEDFGGGALGGVAVVLLGGEHADELAAAVVQLAEFQDFLGRQGPDDGGDDLAEVGQDAGVDGVGLGELAGALGEVADLAGVDDDGGQAGGEQGADGGLLVRAGRLEDDALGREGPRPGDEFVDAGGVVGEAACSAPAGRAWASRRSLQTSTPMRMRFMGRTPESSARINEGRRRSCSGW